MSKLSEQNKIILATAISGVLMIVGFFAERAGFSYYPFIYIIGMIIGGFHQTKEGIKETIEENHLSVDLLMALAAIGACLIQYYFEGIMLTFIFSLSGSLEEYTMNKSKKEIESLLELQPEEAHLLLPDGHTKIVPVETLKIGDHLQVPKGESLPIDGVLNTDMATINEATITGESVPAEKTASEEVFAGTINVGNTFEMTVTKTSDDTIFSKIVQLVDEAQNTPSKTASFIDRIENTYVKVVLMLVPLMIFIPYLFLGWSWSESFYRGMVLLVVASPCALVASATPASLAAISNGARNGVLFKGGMFLDQLAELQAIAFDKTGTLTNGTPVVTDTFILEREQDVINTVVAIESTSTHPLAMALTKHFRSQVTDRLPNLIVNDLTGSGLEGKTDEETWRVGKADFVSTQPLENEDMTHVLKWQKEGKTVVFLSCNNQIVAFFALLDTPKENAQAAIHYFQSENIHTTMITGDHPQTAKAVGQMLNIDEIHAGQTPEEKTVLIKQQKEKYGINAMVGDGINDAPALANATIGVAMGQGTDIAIDVADMVLMQSDLSKLTMSHKIAKKLKRITTQNIIFSVSVIVLLIIFNFMQAVSLPLGVIGHEGSTILVILNGLRMLKKID
ncbi:heavy metal translocating P-type ATPase [Vagococcus lutrae]|uniref:heavy metal translocating P-type ATPase n=1 Tax=Vagococcus lutrae TaxID=81947 RepID=UPI002096AD9E|nr:heavy metal translocating P-type ATPase [Vagococcus lutrae]MCO7150736.1 heavy metal translocating P-type ATPase [Vagococcus lutrae]MDT2812074.1 heavy metal translocating P-type ATPase [Vagococcus lutrae]MDT2818946.1 heavy metal translocating P-type ATPase [Vagococcus lutrae]MDT2843836.1 heavy metal translocating P-type ATPase [Vagococcus lutrae]WCG05919.1 heavy metal translocating P-type ATPase [Vagococcus lutrae]